MKNYSLQQLSKVHLRRVNAKRGAFLGLEMMRSEMLLV